MARPDQGNTRGQREYAPQSPQQGPSYQSSRPDWRTPNQPSRESQPNRGGAFEGPGGPPSRPNYSQPVEPPRQYQNYSRGNSGNSGYSRPPLNMQQPVVTPRRGGSYSAPPVRSAPSGGGNSGRGYQGGSSGGSSRGGSSGGSSRGGNSGGGHFIRTRSTLTLFTPFHSTPHSPSGGSERGLLLS